MELISQDRPRYLPIWLLVTRLMLLKDGPEWQALTFYTLCRGSVRSGKKPRGESSLIRQCESPLPTKVSPRPWDRKTPSRATAGCPALWWNSIPHASKWCSIEIKRAISERSGDSKLSIIDLPSNQKPSRGCTLEPLLIIRLLQNCSGCLLVSTPVAKSLFLFDDCIVCCLPLPHQGLGFWESQMETWSSGCSSSTYVGRPFIRFHTDPNLILWYAVCSSFCLVFSKIELLTTIRRNRFKWLEHEMFHIPSNSPFPSKYLCLIEHSRRDIVFIGYRHV